MTTVYSDLFESTIFAQFVLTCARCTLVDLFAIFYYITAIFVEIVWVRFEILMN